MDSAMEKYCLQIAQERPDVLCSEIPIEVLESAKDDENEPSEFYQDFLEEGHTQWLLHKYGRVPRGKEQIKNAIVLLWLRACRLHTSHVLGRHDPDWDKPFFSDEDLY